ncbi:MAG TPA: hypothetical protein HA356_01795 [Candidatus Poseidoniaceae archaeon]|nr:MAG TPA: hypothetical protein D7H95_01810 [Candidatus Poseidoniales archaeon]HII10790.1 hypothetical protein [Candidatus Poseidoniaceae archaeon]
MSGRVRKGAVFAMVMFVGLVCVGQTAAHEQETYNVVVVAEGPMPANITDSDFVQGNAVVFRMKDTSENASIRISIDLNGDSAYDNATDNISVWLVESCELTENGTLADESCAVSHTYIFDLNAAPGNYSYMFERAVNGSVVSSQNHSMTLWKDVHEEAGVPGTGDCFGIGCEEQTVEATSENITQQEVLIGVMVVAAIGALGLAFSISRDKKIQASDEEDSAAVREEE